MFYLLNYIINLLLCLIVTKLKILNCMYPAKFFVFNLWIDKYLAVLFSFSLGTFLSALTVKVSYYLFLLTYGFMFGVGVGIAYAPPLTVAMKVCMNTCFISFTLRVPSDTYKLLSLVSVIINIQL